MKSRNVKYYSTKLYEHDLPISYHISDDDTRVQRLHWACQRRCLVLGLWCWY